MIRLMVLAAVLLAVSNARAESQITIIRDGRTDTFTAGQLLHRSDLRSLDIPEDVSYKRPMRYRAVPLLALLGGAQDKRSDTLEIKATDGFTAQIPLSLIMRSTQGGSVAWLAIEDPAHRWPALPQRTESAGPFYLVWEHPEKSGVLSEQWPYAMAGLVLVESPVKRWPQLAIPASLREQPVVQAGQKAYLSLCLPCHQLNGGGAGRVGPDLGRPMNATQYLSDDGLRAIIRDPRAVRTWPAQQMSGFGPDTLSDADLNGLISYLRAMRR